MATQTDSEVFTASLGALRNTFRRWGFYEKLNFLYEHIGFGNKWNFRINIGTAKTWEHKSHRFWLIKDTKEENINTIGNNLDILLSYT